MCVLNQQRLTESQRYIGCDLSCCGRNFSNSREWTSRSGSINGFQNTPPTELCVNKGAGNSRSAFHTTGTSALLVPVSTQINIQSTSYLEVLLVLQTR